MTVINAVPAGTHVKLIVLMLLIMLLKDVYCICVAVYFPTQNSLLFSSHGISVLAAGSPLTSPRTYCTNYKCAMKINNSI